jgi:prepilin-type N-terminal cleavage/methylation domain-containing protein/prepilin-type processing-associated H-X9-DG protein
MKQKAFTLIELLVVIAIIAILAAILFPVFAQAKMAAKKAADLSNMKQTGTASLLYSADADDVFVANAEGLHTGAFATAGLLHSYTGFGGDQFAPYGAGSGGPNGAPLGFMDPAANQNWGREIFPYVKSMDMFVSPGARNDTNQKYAPVNLAGAGKTSYVMNGCASNMSQTAMAYPADLITFQSRGLTVKEAIVAPRRNWFSSGWMMANEADPAYLGFTFGKGANYTYADGHAKYKMRNAVKFKDFGFFEYVNIGGNWTPPSRNSTMRADPTKGLDYWGDHGACDPAQEFWTQ